MDSRRVQRSEYPDQVVSYKQVWSPLTIFAYPGNKLEGFAFAFLLAPYANQQA